jgi:hypothetical protein
MIDAAALDAFEAAGWEVTAVGYDRYWPALTQLGAAYAGLRMSAPMASPAHWRSLRRCVTRERPTLP